MPRERSYTGFILKKQPLGEADEIITLYSQELGKLRLLAKSSKLSKSKLQAQLQPMFLTTIMVAGNASLPKIIGASCLKLFKDAQTDGRMTQAWYVACELVLRASADEQKNDLLYQTLGNFLDTINNSKITDVMIDKALIKFKINIAEALGFGILPPENLTEGKLYFSNSRGGFVLDNNSFDSMSISSNLAKSFEIISQTSFNKLNEIACDTSALQAILTSFISYQLERDLKAEAFMPS